MPATSAPPPLAGALALYTLARLALVGAVAGLLVLTGVPLVIAVLVGLIVALPLAMVLFRPLHTRLDAALVARAEERAALRARLRGEPVQRAESEGDRETEPERDAVADDDVAPVDGGADEQIADRPDQSEGAREREADAGRG